MPPILEQAARFVRLLLEHGRPADVVVLSGRRHMTTTTAFDDPRDPVANLVRAFVDDPRRVIPVP